MWWSLIILIGDFVNIPSRSPQTFLISFLKILHFNKLQSLKNIILIFQISFPWVTLRFKCQDWKINLSAYTEQASQFHLSQLFGSIKGFFLLLQEWTRVSRLLISQASGAQLWFGEVHRSCVGLAQVEETLWCINCVKNEWKW